MEQAEIQYVQHLLNKQKRGEEITEAERALLHEKWEELKARLVEIIRPIWEMVRERMKAIVPILLEADRQQRKFKRTNYRYYRHMSKFERNVAQQAVVRRRRVKGVSALNHGYV